MAAGRVRVIVIGAGRTPGPAHRWASSDAWSRTRPRRRSTTCRRRRPSTPEAGAAVGLDRGEALVLQVHRHVQDRAQRLGERLGLLGAGPRAPASTAGARSRPASPRARRRGLRRPSARRAAGRPDRAERHGQPRSASEMATPMRASPRSSPSTRPRVGRAGRRRLARRAGTSPSARPSASATASARFRQDVLAARAAADRLRGGLQQGRGGHASRDERVARRDQRALPPWPCRATAAAAPRACPRLSARGPACRRHPRPPRRARGERRQRRRPAPHDVDARADARAPPSRARSSDVVLLDHPSGVLERAAGSFGPAPPRVHAAAPARH